MKTLFGNREKIKENRDVARAAELEESDSVKTYEVVVKYTYTITETYADDMFVNVDATTKAEAIELAENEAWDSISEDAEIDDVNTRVVKIIAEDDIVADDKTLNMIDD